MSHRRVLWVDTYPDRGDVRIVPGTAYATEANGYILLLARDANGLLTQLRRSRDVNSGSLYHWSLMAESYNATKLPNVRFWIWGREGWVKLKLEPGQKISIEYGGPTEEGWYREAGTYTYETCGDDGLPEIVFDKCSDGSDCDGRLTQTAQFTCPTDQLHHFEVLDKVDGETEFRIPTWTRKRASQRDYTAEAMGY